MGLRKKYTTPQFGSQGDKSWASYKEKNKAEIANTKSKINSKLDVSRGSVNLKTTGTQSESMSPYTYKAPTKVNTQEDFSKRNNSYTGDKAPTYDSMPGKDFSKELEVKDTPSKESPTGNLNSKASGSSDDLMEWAREAEKKARKLMGSREE